MIKLEVGKTYRTKEHRDIYGSKLFVKVIGIIPPTMSEYQYGYRFFADNGLCYSEDGYSTIRESLDRAKDPRYALLSEHYERSRLTEEIKPTAIQWAPETRPIINLKSLAQDSAWINRDDPRFEIGVNRLYVNRMGLTVLIERLRLIHSRPNSDMFVDAKGIAYNLDGTIDRDLESMSDLMFQFVGNPHA